MKISIIGLSLSSSWGNGHATTWRALIGGLQRLGHQVTFLERDVPWYAANRDLPRPAFCDLHFYDGLEGLARFAPLLRESDLVIVGSYVPDGVAVLDHVLGLSVPRLAFYDIDTPVTLTTLRRDCDAAYLARRQIPLLDLYLSFTGGPVLQVLQQEFAAIRAAAFYCAVDEECYSPRTVPQRWDLGYLGTYSPDRQPVLERLLLEPARRLPDRRFVVAGPQYPDGIDWPANVERIEHLAPQAHADFYAAQRFTLNVTRADMVAAGWSPSVRLFEAAACGTPIISDEWPGLTDLLPEGDCITIARSTDDVVQALRDMREAHRLAQAERARSRILSAHTGRARAARLVALIGEIAEKGKPRAGQVTGTGRGESLTASAARR